MATKDLHPDLGMVFRAIAERHIAILGPVSDRFVNEAVMLARKFEGEHDDSLVRDGAKKLLTERYPRVNETDGDFIAKEITKEIVSRRRRLIQR